jgi:uncharacterized membrane protein
MKARIHIYAIVFAAGMLTALADETKTNTQTGATTSGPANINQVAVPPPMTATSAPAPAVFRKVKPPAVVPLTQTSAVPAQSNSTAAFLATTNAIIPPPTNASASASAVTGEESLMQTNAVPVQSNITAAPPPESSEISWKGALAMSVAILAVAGGLVVFMLRRLGKADHASLITRAMSERKDEDKDAGKHEEKHEEKREEKKETQKFPPPMT